jgi:hypothetical protein
MNLLCRIVTTRRYGDVKAVDVMWRADDGSILRDDGATEIPDQIDVPLSASDDFIKSEIEKKRAALYEALAKPGIGITIDPEPMLPNDGLIGAEV